VGLALAGFLFLAGVTGAVIAFQRELDAALNPELLRASTNLPALSLDSLKARAERQLPHAVVICATRSSSRLSRRKALA
jgi:uncharacterized iron-regulated membrane protein